MRKIIFSEPTTQEWVNWRQKCDVATQQNIRLYRGGHKPTLNRKLYKEQKGQVYFNAQEAFRGKCAYCEVKVVNNQPGDMEHYRPFAKVTDENDVGINVQVNGRLKDHPGYYWLAYDWKNLLPSCELCNRANTDDGKKLGKRNRFPVDGNHAYRPGDEGNESPKIINPCDDDPSAHFDFDEYTGLLIRKTPRGEVTEKILGLNLRTLPADRKQTYDDTRNLVISLVLLLGTDRNSNASTDSLNRLKKIDAGHEQFTMASKKALADIGALINL